MPKMQNLTSDTCVILRNVVWWISERTKMRLSISKSKNATSLYVVESTYVNQVRSTRVVEKLGTLAQLEKDLGGQDPVQWAKHRAQELTKEKKDKQRDYC